MRKILNISLPKSMADTVKQEVKQGGFASASEFIRHMIREYKTNKLAKELKRMQKDFEAGKGIELKSFDQLKKKPK